MGKTKKKTLRFGVIVDIQAALEMAFGGGNRGGGLSLASIDPISFVRKAVERHEVKIIELPADANYLISGILDRGASGLVALREELDLEYTMHLPYMQVHLCSFNEHVRAASVDTIVEIITLAEEKIGGIESYVLHVTSELEDNIGAFDIPRHYKELAWGLFLENGYKSMEEIIERTGVPSRKIAVENNEGIPFSDVYDILIDDLDLSITLDVGHAILQGDETPIDIVDRWGPDRIREIHLHNVIRKKVANRITIDSDHHGLDKGVLDVEAFLDHLEEIDYKNPVLLEIMTQEEIASSLAMLRDLGFM